jgi:two-component system chemotaxis sensor kinase CheA
VTVESAAISRAVEPPTIRTEAQSVLLFKAGGPEPFAVALPTVRRVEPIDRGRIERIGPAEFVTVEGRPTRVVRLDQWIPVAGGPDPERLFLLLPRTSRRPVGLLITEVIDSVAHAGDLQPDGPPGEGVLGTAVIHDRLTVFLDLYRLFDRADPASPPALPAASGRKRVLLVEDTQFFRQLVRGYLEAGGYEVETANDGTEGLRVLEEKSFDLVISDIEMPGLDGWGLARAVRQKSRQPDIPLMALTTRASEQDRAKSLACGFDHHEQKLDRDRFLAAVVSLLQTGRPRAKGG